MTSVFHEVEIDYTDPTRVADFWAAAFGWEVREQGEFLWMSATGNPADSPVFEHYQDDVGAFVVPDVLRPLTGFERVGPRSG